MTISVLQSAAWRARNFTRRLTIGIPTWNRVDRLERQLRLLEPALLAEVELVVCDNGSNDGTWEALSRFCDGTSNAVSCVRSGANLGADANYLRVMEAASGDWLWLVGDDEDINFSKALPELLYALRSVEAGIILLLNHSELPRLTSVFTRLSLLEFLAPEYDLLGLHLHQVGRVVSHVPSAKQQLRVAHRLAGGLLHSYAPVYGTLLCEKGLGVLKLSLYPEKLAGPENSRWDLLRGHVGAWKMSLTAFPSETRLVGARENRLRQKALLSIVVRRLICRVKVDAEDIKWMIRAFTLKGKLGLFALLVAFSFDRRIALALLSRRHSGFIAMVRAEPPAANVEY